MMLRHLPKIEMETIWKQMETFRKHQQPTHAIHDLQTQQQFASFIFVQFRAGALGAFSFIVEHEGNSSEHGKNHTP
jgi:hypothetical protein